jgi:hypothetical protein
VARRVLPPNLTCTAPQFDETWHALDLLERDLGRSGAPRRFSLRGEKACQNATFHSPQDEDVLLWSESREFAPASACNGKDGATRSPREQIVWSSVGR